MELLEKNFACIEKYRPSFYKKLKKIYDDKEYSYEGMQTLETREDCTALCVEKDGKTVRLNSAYKPLQEAARWAKQYKFQNLNVSVLMFGIGNGVFVREMLHNLAGDAWVFLVEPDVSLFLYNLEHNDMTDILSDTRVMIFVEEINKEGFEGNLEDKIHWSMLPTQIICVHPGFEKLYLKQHNEFQLTAKHAIEIAVVNRNTISTLSTRLVKNVLQNLHFIKESNYITEFIGEIPEDIPVIIVAAGPSLDKNIEELKQAEGKAIIFATDTSVKYLVQHKIHFDVMITLDARKSKKHIKDNECEMVPMFCVMEAKNILMEFHKGRKIWFRSGIYIENLYRKFGLGFPEQNTGGSVATAAFMVSLILGVKRIVLIGQDLAFQGNVTHAGQEEKHVAYEDEGIITVEGIDGKPVRSRYDWGMYIDWFEEAIRVNPDVDVIDATEGGALIHGSRLMTLKDTIKEYCTSTFDFQKIVDGKPYTFDNKTYELVKTECCHLQKDFDAIYQRAFKANKAANELMKLIDAGKSNPQKEEKLLSQIRHANNFIDKQAANELLEIYISERTMEEMQKINCIGEDEDQNIVDTLKISTVVYKEMLKAIDELQPLLKESLAKL